MLCLKKQLPFSTFVIVVMLDLFFRGTCVEQVISRTHGGKMLNRYVISYKLSVNLCFAGC